MLVVEGGSRSLKKLQKLLLKRIKWGKVRPTERVLY
jgi:hypothetical protein